MAVAFDAESESHTGTTGNTGTPNPFTWTHAGASNARAAVVFVFTIGGSNNRVTGVSYGSVAMAAVPYTGTDSLTEPAVAQAWFLDAIPTGSQTVSVTRTNTETVYAMCFTVTAAWETEVYLPGVITMGGNSATTGASSSNTGTGSPAAMSIDDGSPGTNSMRFVGQYYGGTALTTGANTTAGPTFITAQLGVWGWRQTSASQGSVAIGTSTTTVDDRATVGLAIRERPIWPKYTTSIYLVASHRASAY